MTGRLIAMITAAALALGPMGATSAAAFENKDRKALALLLGAATLGIIIHQNNKKKKKERAQSVSRGNLSSDRPYVDDHDHRHRHGYDAYRGHRRQAVIPAQCVFPIRGQYGRRDVVSERCIIELGVPQRLPKDCAFRVRDQWGNRTVYGTRCLSDRGWRFADVR